MRVESEVKADVVDLVDRSDVEQKYIISFLKRELFYDEGSDGMLPGFFFRGSEEVSASDFIRICEAGYERTRALPYKIGIRPGAGFYTDFNYISREPIKKYSMDSHPLSRGSKYSIAPMGFTSLGNPVMW